MNVPIASTRRTSRRRILIEAARILVASFAGWVVGAAIIWQVGSGSLGEDVGLLVLAAVLWAVIPLSILRVLVRRTGSPKRERPRQWGIWFAIAALTGSAAIGIMRPFTENWTTFQVWAAVFALTPFGIALDTVPRLIRPSGWTGIGAGARIAIPLALLATCLVVFALAIEAADGPVALVGSEILIGVAALSIVVVLGFAARLPLVTLGAIGLLYTGFSILVQFVWLPVANGLVTVDVSRTLALHLVAALALIVATAVVQVFRHTGQSTAESALVDWLRAEAILPEAPTAEGRASS